MDGSKLFTKRAIFCYQEYSFKTPKLRSDLCDYSHAYIVVKGGVTIIGTNNVSTRKTLTFRSNGPLGDTHQRSVAHS